MQTEQERERGGSGGDRQARQTGGKLMLICAQLYDILTRLAKSNKYKSKLNTANCLKKRRRHRSSRVEVDEAECVKRTD